MSNSETTANLLPILDLAPEQQDMRSDVIAGLSQSPKRISSKYFYDRRGSELFDAICETPEYYPTRTELGIMHEALDEISGFIGPHATVMEIGSGSGLKTELLIESLERPSSYIPVDISRQHLEEAAERLAQQHPDLEIAPVCADFTQTLRFPDGTNDTGRRVVYFPGSTLGNLTSTAAERLLERFAQIASPKATERSSSEPEFEPSCSAPTSGLLLGVDLVKDTTILENAYNDAEGVTAAFNLNMLHHINRELQCEIPVGAFEHDAPFVDEEKRIEMHLVANQDLEFEIADQTFSMRSGERIVTEYSHKYELSDLRQRLADCGWKLVRVWTDPRDYFALLYCESCHANACTDWE